MNPEKSTSRSGGMSESAINNIKEYYKTQEGRKQEKLTDEQVMDKLLDISSNYESMNENIMILSPRVAEKTDSGVIKGTEAMATELKERGTEASLVVFVPKKYKDEYKFGDEIYVQGNAMGTEFCIDGIYLANVDNFSVVFKKKKK